MEQGYQILEALGGEIGFLPALIIIGLGLLCWRLLLKIFELQEKRAAEGKETILAMTEQSKTLQTAIDMLRRNGG